MQKDTCTRSLQPFTITRRRKQPKCPSTDEWIKTWYSIYNELSPNHKRNDTGSFVLTWRDLESVLQSEVSKKEENQYHILRHKCGTQKNDSEEPICWAGIETQRERRGGVNREIGIGVCALPYVRQTASGKLLCSSGSSTGCPVVSWRGGLVGEREA